MIRRISLEEKRKITRATYERLGFHVEHFYPFTAIPIRAAQIKIGAADVRQALKAAEAEIAKAEQFDGHGKKS